MYCLAIRSFELLPHSRLILQEYYLIFFWVV